MEVLAELELFGLDALDPDPVAGCVPPVQLQPAVAVHSELRIPAQVLTEDASHSLELESVNHMQLVSAALWHADSVVNVEQAGDWQRPLTKLQPDQDVQSLVRSAQVSSWGTLALPILAICMQFLGQLGLGVP